MMNPHNSAYLMNKPDSSLARAYLSDRAADFTPIARHVDMILKGRCDDEVDRWLIGRDLNMSMKEARIEVAKVHLSCLDDERAWVDGPKGDLYVSWTDEALVHEADPLIYDEDGNFLEESDVVEHVREQLIQMDRELYGPRDSGYSGPSSRERYEMDYASKREARR